MVWHNQVPPFGSPWLAPRGTEITLGSPGIASDGLIPPGARRHDRFGHKAVTLASTSQRYRLRR